MSATAPPASNLKGFAVAATYGIISISITFFNKAVLSVYNFPYSNTLTLGQMVTALVLMYLMKRFKYISYPDFNLTTAKATAPLAIWFSGMVVTGLGSLGYVNVPIYNTLRRLTTFIVMAGEFLYLGKRVPWDEAMSVVLMVGGAFVCGYGDLSFHLFGYAFTILNCVVTAGYLVSIKVTKQKTNCGEFEMMFYNNMLSIPLIVVLVVVLEWHDVVSYKYLFDAGFVVCFLMSSVQAFLLNYFIFLCSTVNSPLTTSITGQIKAIASSIIGLFIFGDVIITSLLIVGLLISSFGSVYYGAVKYQQQMKTARDKAAREAAAKSPV
jgi:solute carrier family 35 protein